MEKPEGYPEVDAPETELPNTRTSFLGTKNDMSLLESGLLRRSWSGVGDDYYRFESKAGKSVDPRLLALLEFFRELYFRRHELFKKTFPGRHDKFFLDMVRKLGEVLSQVNSDQTKMRTMQRSLSIGSPRELKGGESELRLERFKVTTINVDDGGQGGDKTKSSGSK